MEDKLQSLFVRFKSLIEDEKVEDDLIWEKLTELALLSAGVGEEAVTARPVFFFGALVSLCEKRPTFAAQLLKDLVGLLQLG